MLFDWSAECSADDPVLVVPWEDPSSPLRFIDLRDDPYAIDSIPEAEEHPALQHALRSLNSVRSPVFTAKCDVWEADDAERENLRLHLALEPEETAAAVLSYLDLLCRDRALFTSFHQQGHLLGRLERRLAPVDQPFSAAECIIRPALLDLTTPQEGFSISLYLKAVGSTAAEARSHWSSALDAVIAILRTKDLFPQT